MKKFIIQTVKNRKWIAVGFAILTSLSLWALLHLPIDAVPDITPVQVVVNTKTGALDPEQIEKTISFPIENELNGITGVEEVRSLSKYGLSQVVVRFADQTNIYWARQQISERLQGLAGQLPEKMTPMLAPITTGLGEVLMYTVLPKTNSELFKKSEKEQLLYLRTYQDLVLAPYLKRTVKGIASVDSSGGFKQEIHIDILPNRLAQYGISIEELAEKIETLGENFGGGYIQSEGKQMVVRSSGRLSNLETVRRLAVKLDVYGNPVRLSQVANVRVDHAQRLGAATYEGKEIVLGIVLMLSGANSSQVAKDCEAALKKMALPQDLELKILYSRSYLVHATIKTVEKNLVEGALLVVVVLFLILGNLRAALIVAAAIPFSMMFTFLGMKSLGISASLMSLGAIDFGLLVEERYH
jgi:cobalt-zinc-cadmium resistance protein CzcA